MRRIVDVFVIADPCNRMLASWLTAVALAVIVVGTTVTLVAVTHVPGPDFQVAVSRR